MVEVKYPEGNVFLPGALQIPKGGFFLTWRAAEVEGATEGSIGPN